MQTQLTTMHEESTDPLYDTRPAHLAALFGERTKTALQTGRPVSGLARMAASYAAMVVEKHGKVIGRITPQEPYGISLGVSL